MSKTGGIFVSPGSESKPSDGGSEQEMSTHNILLKKLLAQNKEAATSGKVALGPRYSIGVMLIDDAGCKIDLKNTYYLIVCLSNMRNNIWFCLVYTWFNLFYL